MDEVDGLLLQSLSLLGWEREEGHDSVESLTADEVTEAVVRCLWAVNPTIRTTIPSAALPPNMTARFRLTTAIADAIRGLGYRGGELGYQTILYGSHTQLRDILLFLVQRLPKEPAPEPGQLLSAEDHLDRLISFTRAKLKARLAAPWLPHYCDRFGFLWDGRLWHPPDGALTHRFNSNKPRAWRHFPDAAIAASSALTPATSEDRLIETELLLRSLSDCQTKPSMTVKPKLAPKPALPPKPKIGQTPNSEPQQPSEEELKRKEELERLRSERRVLQAELEELGSRIVRMRNETMRAEEESALEEAETSKLASEAGSLRRWATALEAPKDAQKQLQTRLLESERRVGELERRWREASQPLLEELGRLRSGAGGAASSVRAETEELRSACRAMVEEAEWKQTQLSQLEKELSRSAGGGLSRAAYTARILEMVASVGKQRAEIERVLGERREAEGEVNRLSGRLERSLVAAEGTLFGPAKTDDVWRRVYKLVLSIHERCEQSQETMSELGSVGREQQDLQEALEREAESQIDSSLERLINDLCAVQQENQTLASSLSRLQEP